MNEETTSMESNQWKVRRSATVQSNVPTPTEITNTIRCCFNGVAIINATTVITGNISSPGRRDGTRMEGNKKRSGSLRTHMLLYPLAHNM